VFLNKGVVSIISFTKWVKNFLNFKPQGVASFTVFAALHGFLHMYAAYKGFSLQKSIMLGVCSASCSISQADSISGMSDYDSAIELFEKYGYYTGIKII
jgi:hypothetical protein